ncbi:MAG: CDP-alcohol phosphatidyltransferase family protein [Micrococcales bacterium]|nr:CDP-alcohol phosphatidyltransferase family protein [Micrococcales bacterium]
MLGVNGREVARVLFTPPAKGLLKIGVTADMVTMAGTALTVGASCWMFPRGWLWQGAVVVAVLVCTDALDGTMARLVKHPTKWGAFLDSTLDRIADAAIFGSIAAYFVVVQDRVGAVASLAALALGTVVPYARARAEALGLKASGGIAERSDRLLVSLVAAFLTGLGLSRWFLVGAMMLISAMAAITIVQRARAVWVQGNDTPPDEQ